MSQPYPVVVLMTRREFMRKIVPISLLVLLVVSVMPMPAASLTVSDEVEYDTNDTEVIQRVDGDGDGNYHVIFRSDAPSGDTFHLLYMKVDPSGKELVSPLKVTPNNLDDHVGNTALAIDSAGRAHIAISMTTGDGFYVHYAQVGSGGSVAVAPKKVSDGDAPGGLDIETDSSGNAYIVWEERGDPTKIMWAKVSSAGAIVKQPKEISGDLGIQGAVAYPRLGVTTSGDNLIVWQQKSNIATTWDIWFTRLDSSGTVEVDPRESITNTIADTEFLEATVHSSESELHVVWLESGDAQYAVVDSGGDVLTTRELYASVLGTAGSPDVAVSANGNVVLSYGIQEFQADWALWAEVYWADDDDWDGPEQINDPDRPPGYFGRPGATNNGGAIVFTRNSNLQLVTLTKDAANRPPVAVLSFSPVDPEVDQAITFDGRDSTDPDDGDTVEEFFFEYGDGSSSGWVTTPTVLHSYSGAGTYTARLRVRDNQGLESTSADTASVTVTSASTNREPTAVLTVDNNAPDKGQEVNFDGTSSFDTDGVVSQYLFNFGDGVNSGWVSTATVKHAYTKEGVYTATLKVRDDEGAESELDSVQISVVDTNEPPTATIVSIDPNPAYVGDDITFEGSGADTDGTIEGYSWESDMDGVLGTTATLTMKLQQGTHIISFKVQDDDDDWSQVVTQQVTVVANSVFLLSDETELPKQAYTDKLIDFRVVYTDVDNDPPTVTNLVYSKGNDWKTVQMGEVDTSDTDYTDGKEYYYQKKFDEGDWKYHFEFRNSQHPEKKTADVSFNVKEPEGLLPGYGAGAVIGALLVAVSVVTVTHRGRKREHL